MGFDIIRTSDGATVDTAPTWHAAVSRANWLTRDGVLHVVTPQADAIIDLTEHEHEPLFAEEVA